MMEYMQDYGVDANTAEEAFDEDELDDSDFEYDHANENISHQSRNSTETERHKRNTTTRVAEMLQVSRYQVQRVWRRIKECRAQGRPVDVRSRKPMNCGRKKKNKSIYQRFLEFPCIRGLIYDL